MTKRSRVEDDELPPSQFPHVEKDDELNPRSLEIDHMPMPTLSQREFADQFLNLPCNEEQEEQSDLDTNEEGESVQAIMDIVYGEHIIDPYADYSIKPNDKFPSWLNYLIKLKHGDNHVIKEEFYRMYESEKHTAFGDKWPIFYKYSIIIDNGTTKKRSFEQSTMMIKSISIEQINQFLSQLVGLVDFALCQCDKTERGCIEYQHYHIILISSKEYQANRFRSVFNKYFGCDDEYIKKHVRKFYYRKMSFSKICSNMSPWAGMTNYIAVGSVVNPDYASGYNDQLNPICKKSLKFHRSDENSLNACILYDCHPDWYIAFKHRLTRNHVNCFSQRTVINTKSSSPFQKIYTFFSKYGCIDVNTVHIKLSKKDYDHFSSSGMWRQWNKALERWVNDKIMQWDWRNFHNTLAPRSKEVYDSTDSSHRFLRALLEFQGYGQESLSYFCSAMYEVLNKTSGKRNCIYIWGASSSGKTYLLNNYNLKSDG